MSRCHGNNPDSCCYIRGVQCPFVVERVGERRWVCRLREILGSWEAVAESDAWEWAVEPMWKAAGLPDPEDGRGCWDWPEQDLQDAGVASAPWACCYAEENS